jgi:hypothetical protein
VIALASTVITGAVEGDLDEAIIRRISDYAGVGVGVVHGRRGKPQLLEALSGYNEAARFAPWLVLVDLDSDFDCGPTMRGHCLPNPAPQMCFRIAVRAVEAWIMADRERIAEFLGVSRARIPQVPDDLDDPKRELVNITRHSRRMRVRDDILPREGSGRSVGPLYTARMMEFVLDPAAGWRIDAAMDVSDSLNRCVRCIGRLRSIAEG